MFNNFKATAFSYAQKLMEWADPQWWIWLSFCVFVLCMIHLLPLKLKEDNHDFSDRIFLATRLLLLIGVGALLLLPLIFYLAFGILTESSARLQASQIVTAWYYEMLADYWGMPVAAWLAGLTTNFCWHRYGGPFLSNLRRKFRVTQAEDERSDIRKTLELYKTKRFKPEQYFKEGFYFIGLDDKDKPIYIPADVFESTHSASFAPTGFGKGVEHGVILTQAIRRGNPVWWIDPKGDKRAPFILQQEAKRAGRPYIYLDLNPEGSGNWHPFKGGSLRDRRSRILAAFGLVAGGTNADVYKSRERSFVDRILAATDGSIAAMFEAAKTLIKPDELSELRDGLAEWAQISTFTPNRKRKGHSIEQCILNNAIVYVKGSLTDNVVKSATKAYVSELIQEANRLYPQRTTHITAFIDETRFLISKEIVDALATTRELRMNMLLATQAIADLRTLDDKTIDGEALQKSVEVNCQIKMIYKAGDSDTAVWGERLAGTKTIRVTGNERTEINRWGAEEWGKVRSFNTEEVPLFHQNVFLSLPHMVFVLYQPTDLPTVAFSSWVDVDQSECSWIKKDLEPAADGNETTSEAGPASPAPASVDSSASVPSPATVKSVQATAPQVAKVVTSSPKGAAAPSPPPVKKARSNPKLAAPVAPEPPTDEPCATPAVAPELVAEEPTDVYPEPGVGDTVPSAAIAAPEPGLQEEQR